MGEGGEGGRNRGKERSGRGNTEGGKGERIKREWIGEGERGREGEGEAEGEEVDKKEMEEEGEMGK